jgi:mono/diheme cytochrome c family protein
MRKNVLSLVMLGLILGVMVTALSCGTMIGSSSTTVPFGLETITTLAATQAADGKALYLANCAPCHGVDFQGGKGPTLNVLSPEFDIGLVEYQILHGDALMPGFYGKLTSSEIAAVARYVLEKR